MWIENFTATIFVQLCNKRNCEVHELFRRGKWIISPKLILTYVVQTKSWGCNIISAGDGNGAVRERDALVSPLQRSFIF